MNFIEQWQADRKLQKTIAGLDLSAGMTDAPSLTAFDGTDPGLKEYFDILKGIDKSLAEVAGKPEAVHCGFQSLVPGTVLYDQNPYENKYRKTPPRHPHFALLDEFHAKDAATAVKHLTQLTAVRCGISKENQEKLVAKAVNSLKENRGVGARIQVGEDWELAIGVQRYRDGQVFITPSLVPVEKPEYAENLIKETTGLLAKNIKPDNLSKIVDAAAETNYCVNAVETSCLDELNVGGFIGAERLVRRQGWQPLKREDLTDDSILSMLFAGTEIYLHSDHKPEDPVALLGKNNYPSTETIKFSAIPSPALKEKIRGEFKGKFELAAKQVIKQRIQRVPAGKKLIDLSPASLIDPALESLRQKLEYHDNEREEDWLSSLTARALIDELRHYPEARPIAERLTVLQGLAGDQSTLTHHQNAKVNFGLNETAMQFLLPKDWFQK